MKLKYASKWIMALSATALLAACADGGSDSEGTGTDEASGDFDTSGTITVVARDTASGTRGAFNEITGVLVEDGDTETDNTAQSAIIQSGTQGVITAVSEDINGIGYISLGSLNDTVKGVMIDDVEPTHDTVADGTYPIARPFNMAYGEDLTPQAQEFWDFIFSAEGQALVEEEGYIPVEPDAAAYEEAEGIEGTISLAGSTSVEPVATVISEAFTEIYPDVTFEISATGSSAGVTAAQDATADIGMASRELSEEEAASLTVEAIANDGIAVVVNNDNPLEGLTLDQVRQIFVGEITNWDDVME
ncbi:phosphate ABC transporter substrate-binding protein [Marinilactibacillus sp. 15R]|uniref:Phosphate transport system substrate-binding protein n=1 Tax=Marinilactibacillus piezotolerans TaxID=258723 RepID=A0A1I4A1Q4_9LACT|nr:MULTISPECIES: substrate-binding domain-containing protein [Marinilactibacillus]API90144.1 phosphate ABC transporter substrate-binding protein [Marinilactibacillus sp. 15R]SFK50285.1 phosphate transport system substrate-binding protein [Marinilactibacillus piezotolerans]